MISSITLIILQIIGAIHPADNQSFWKWYIPVCLIEIAVYFRLLTKLGGK